MHLCQHDRPCVLRLGEESGRDGHLDDRVAFEGEGAQGAEVDDPAVRGIVIGALIGAACGLLVGGLLYLVFSSSGSFGFYEISGILLGALVGLGFGAFYGGALRLPRDR